MSIFFFALDGILNSKKIENNREKTIGLQLIIFISSLHEHKPQHSLNIEALLHILHTLNWKVCFKSKNKIADSTPICAFMNLK